MKHAGHWTVDPIHDGVSPANGGKRDLLVYIAKPDNVQQGIYVNVDHDGKWSVDRFEDAIPHMGDALYIPSKTGQEANFSEAMARLIEKMGLSFLLALTHGSSPYRSI